MKRVLCGMLLLLSGCGATPRAEACVGESDGESGSGSGSESGSESDGESGSGSEGESESEPPLVGVLRRPVTFDGRDFIELATASGRLTVPAPPPPPTCTSRTLVDADLPFAGAVSAAIVGAQALVAVDVWPGSGAEHARTWVIDLASGAMQEGRLDGEISARATVHGGELLLSTWRQGGGVRFHAYGSHAAPPDSTLGGLGTVLGSIDGPDGSLWVWHHRAMSEAGDPLATLTRIHPDGHLESTTGETHGAFLGVLPDDRGATLWRTPLLGHHGDVTTVQHVSPSLALERDVVARERVSGLACPFFFESGPREGRLVCTNGDTWTLSSGGVHPGLAFGGRLVAAAGTDLPIAARLDQDTGELVLETFGGAFARMPRHGREPLGTALAIDGPRVVVAWLDAPDRDAIERHFEIRALDCALP